MQGSIRAQGLGLPAVVLGCFMVATTKRGFRMEFNGVLGCFFAVVQRSFT